MSTIYGEFVSGNGRIAVTISELAPEGCQVRLAAAREPPPGDLALWIGAIGPFAITATPERARCFVARFRQPLEPAIIAHFNA